MRSLKMAFSYPKDNLGFTADLGWPEQVIFREFYPRGLTAVDDIDDITLGNVRLCPMSPLVSKWKS